MRRTNLRRIILSLLMIPIVFLTYYLVEQYHLREASKILEDFQFVEPERLNYLSIVQYPEKRVYTSFHDDEVRQMLNTLNELELKKAKLESMSENYTKLRFMEDGSHGYIEYYLYDNGFIKYVEDSLAGGRSITYKMEEEKLNEFLASLLKGKTLE